MARESSVRAVCALIGHCASGKSSLLDELRKYKAAVAVSEKDMEDGGFLDRASNKKLRRMATGTGDWRRVNEAYDHAYTSIIKTLKLTKSVGEKLGKGADAPADLIGFFEAHHLGDSAEHVDGAIMVYAPTEFHRRFQMRLDSKDSVVEQGMTAFVQASSIGSGENSGLTLLRDGVPLLVIKVRQDTGPDTFKEDIAFIASALMTGYDSAAKGGKLTFSALLQEWSAALEKGLPRISVRTYQPGADVPETISLMTRYVSELHSDTPPPTAAPLPGVPTPISPSKDDTPAPTEEKDNGGKLPVEGTQPTP